MSSIFNALFRSVSAAPTPAPPPAGNPIIAPTPAKVDAAAPTPPSPITQTRRHVSAPLSPKTSMVADAPYPPSPYTPGHGPTGDHSYDITSSSISEPTDILFPRGIPYVHRRQLHAQAEADGTPIKTPSFYQPSGASRSRSIVIRDPSDPAPPKAEVKKPVQLTEWRKEQLRRQNQPRLIEPIVLRAIPALHGPPNLPYARNPSGVDSSIPDDSVAYLSYPTNQHAQLLSPSGDIFPQNPSQHTFQPHHEPQAAPAIIHPPTIRPTTRVPYQQHVETADLIQGDGGEYKRGGPVHPPVAHGVKANRPEARLTPSEVLRAQMHTLPPSRPLESIIEHPVHPAHSVPVSRPLYLDIARKRAPTGPPTTVAAQKIVEDVDTYPTTPRYVAEAEAKSIKSEAKPTKPEASPSTKVLTEEESATKAFLANSKADASVNWRLKTPAKASGSRIASFDKYTPSADRSDDAPTMTIDSLFEKFAPSSGTSPITIKVNTPPHSDPAVKEVSQTPLTKKPFDTHLLRAPTPDLGTPIRATPTPDVSLSSEAFVEDLITLTSEPDENAPPKRPAKKANKSKGTPWAGKLLKKAGGGKGGKDEEAAPVVPAVKVPKSPLGVAKTVTSSGKGKAPRVA